MTSPRPVKIVVDEVKEKFATIISTITSPKSSPNMKQGSRKRKLVETNENVDDSATPPSDKMNTRSMEDFYKRLKTFSASEWFGKPLCLSPIVMSSYGWYLLKEDVVICSSCQQMFVVDLPWSGSDNYTSEVLKCVENIKSCHNKMCAWPNTYISPIMDLNDHMYDQFQFRVNSLISLDASLPLITEEVLEFVGLTREQVKKIYSTVTKETGDDVAKTDDVTINDDVMISAVVLALCGWEKSTNELADMLTCQLTQQNIGLWGITKVESKVESGEKQVSPKRRRGARRSTSSATNENAQKIDTTLFHPLNEHLRWSPWISNMDINQLFENPLEFGNDDVTDCGWKSLKRVITNMTSSQNDVTMKKTKVVDSQMAYEQADKLLQSWDSPTVKKKKYSKLV